MVNRRRSRCQACAFFVVAHSIRSCLAFAPSLVARSGAATSTRSPAGTSPATTTSDNRVGIPWRRAVATSAAAVGPLRAAADEDEDDDGEELVGMAEFLAQKAVRDRGQLLGGRRPPSPIDLLGEEDDDDDDDDDDDGGELVGMAEFLAQNAVRDRDRRTEERQPPSPPSTQPPPPTKLATDEGKDDGVDEEELEVGMAEILAQKAQRERRMEERQSPSLSSTPQGGAAPAVDLGMEGGIFPSDVFPGSATDEITLQGAKLEPGQPEALVGFWKLYGATGDREDVSGRVILRADGQVIGGPTVRKTPGVAWSDPEGLRPVGGQWEVYSDTKTGRARLKFTIVLSFQKKQQLEMDGVVMSVDGGSEGAAALEPQLQIFGGVSKRSGAAAEPEAGGGDFSMTKIPAGEGELIATVGSQRKRLW